MSTTLERAVLTNWKAGAHQYYFGRCDSCGRTENEDGKPLLVARQTRRRERECLDCYGKRTG